MLVSFLQMLPLHRWQISLYICQFIIVRIFPSQTRFLGEVNIVFSFLCSSVSTCCFHSATCILLQNNTVEHSAPPSPSGVSMCLADQKVLRCLPVTLSDALQRDLEPADSLTDK